MSTWVGQYELLFVCGPKFTKFFRPNVERVVRTPVVRSNGRSYKMRVMFFFLFFALRSPRSLGRSPWNFYRMIGIILNFIMQVQKLGEHSPAPNKKIPGPKHAKFRSNLDHFRFWLRISPERANISKIGKRYKLWQFLLRLMKKVRWTLVH